MSSRPAALVGGVWWRIARGVVRAGIVLLFRAKLVGRASDHGPYLLVANHAGWVDPFVIIALFPASPRPYFIGDRRATMSVRWKRLLLGTLGVVIPVERDGSVSERAAIDRALAVLARGDVVAVFPEGPLDAPAEPTCPRCAALGRVLALDASGEHSRPVARFQRGVAYLAMRAHVPVVPLWLSGTAELYARRPLAAIVGDAMDPPPCEPTKAATTAFACELRRAVLRMAGESIDHTPTPHRWRGLTHLM